MKLFAGGSDSEYEYAVWAKNKIDVAIKLDWVYGFVTDKEHGFNEQKGKSLKAIIADKSKVYRRKLDDVSDWEIWKDIQGV
jgi:hypothetical protein